MRWPWTRRHLRRDDTPINDVETRMNDLTTTLETRTQQLRELVLLERPGGGMGEPAMHVVGQHRNGGRL